MATTYLRGESAPVILPNQFPPMPAVARILSRFDRDQLHGFIAVAIDLADAMDGDSDTEANGDELDGNASEEDFMYHGGDGPGCPIADPDYAVDDLPCDAHDEGV